MTHIVCGYPSLEESQKIINILKNYSKFIEIQFPFSDPIADWPIIEKANHTALKNWIKIKDCFNFTEKNTKDNVKILIMTYYNIVFNYGLENFVKKASEIGVRWLIIPDIPYDQPDGQILRDLCNNHLNSMVKKVSVHS